MSKFAPHRRGINNPPATSGTVCQKCLGKGHYTYECKSSRPYVSRPSRTELLDKPKLLSKLKKEGQPSVELPQEFKTKTGTADKILEAKERERKDGKAENERPKKKPRRGSRSSSDSSSSDSDSTSGSSGSSSGSESEDSPSESSRSRSRDRRRRKPLRPSRSPSRSDGD